LGDVMVRSPRKPAHRPAEPKLTNLIRESIELAPGKERHIEFHLRGGDVLTVTCKARSKFYAALLSRDAYTARIGGGGPDTFGFKFGTDAQGFTDRIEAAVLDDYYLVLRDGVFSPRVHIETKVDILRRGKVEPNIRSG
jgi:hypothetical protein